MPLSGLTLWAPRFHRSPLVHSMPHEASGPAAFALARSRLAAFAQAAAPARHLGAHLARAGRPNHLTPAHGLFQVKDLAGIRSETLLDRAQLLEREVVQSFSVAF